MGHLYSNHASQSLGWGWERDVLDHLARSLMTVAYDCWGSTNAPLLLYLVGGVLAVLRVGGAHSGAHYSVLQCS